MDASRERTITTIIQAIGYRLCKMKINFSFERAWENVWYAKTNCSQLGDLPRGWPLSEKVPIWLIRKTKTNPLKALWESNPVFSNIDIELGRVKTWPWLNFWTTRCCLSWAKIVLSSRKIWFWLNHSWMWGRGLMVRRHGDSRQHML